MWQVGLEVRKDITATVLRKKARCEKDGRVASRLLGIANILDGMDRDQAARCVGMTRQTLRDWVRRYNDEGVEGTLTHEFAKLMERLPSLPRVRFHDLRHSHATQLLASGIHPKIAQERLGHSTITTTLDLYSHATSTMQSEAASTLDTAFRSAIKSRSNKGPQLG